MLATVDAALEGSKEPVRLFKVEDRHHGLDMWERICETGEDLTQLPPYLLMPPGYEFAEDKDELLMEMARLYIVNQLVSGSCCSASPPSISRLGFRV